jgi:hypothetical protein
MLFAYAVRQFVRALQNRRVSPCDAHQLYYDCSIDLLSIGSIKKSMTFLLQPMNIF